jgi:ABC-type branched-subunit amino acid transport system ATPase component
MAALRSQVSIVVGEQEIVVILGANGAGKSTLLKVIAGIVPHLTGSAISLGGRALTDLARTRSSKPASRWCRRAAASSRS